MDRGRTVSPYQHVGYEGSPTDSGCFSASDHGRVCGLDGLQCYSSGIHKKQRYFFPGHVQFGERYSQLGRTVLCHPFRKIHSGEEDIN